MEWDAEHEMQDGMCGKRIVAKLHSSNKNSSLISNISMLTITANWQHTRSFR